MDTEISNLWNSLVKASGKERKKLFIAYCLKLIEAKEKGEMREEEAAYEMVGAFQFHDLVDSPECYSILDAAGEAEISRELSYAQPMGQWDEKTANKTKETEWWKVILAVDTAKNLLQ